MRASARRKTTLTNLTGRIVGLLIFGQGGDVLGAAGSNLLTLKFSRDDEREADLVGMELAARARLRSRRPG